MKKLFAFLVLPFVFSCSQSEIRRDAAGADAQETYPFQIVFSSGRWGEVDPCGCSIRSIGGFGREANVLQKWRKDAGKMLSISSGTSFVSNVAPDKKTLPLYRERAEKMVTALTAMETTAYAPSATEMVLGADFLSKLAKTSGFTWVSANLVAKKDRKPLFQTHHVVSLSPEFQVFLTSVTTAHTRWMKSPDVLVQDVNRSLREVFKGKDLTKSLVVVVSDLSESENAALWKKFPEIDAVLASEVAADRQTFTQETASTLRLSPEGRGRRLARLLFSAPKGQKHVQWRNVTVRNQMENLMIDWKSKILLSEDQLAKASAKEARQIKAYKQRMASLIQEKEPIVAEVSDPTPYDYTVVELDSQFDPPQPALQAIADAVKKIDENLEASKKSFSVRAKSN